MCKMHPPTPTHTHTHTHTVGVCRPMAFIKAKHSWSKLCSHMRHHTVTAYIKITQLIIYLHIHTIKGSVFCKLMSIVPYLRNTSFITKAWDRHPALQWETNSPPEERGPRRTQWEQSGEGGMCTPLSPEKRQNRVMSHAGTICARSARLCGA